MGSRRLLEYVLPRLTDHPDDVVITEIDGESGNRVYELSVNPEDMGKVIGKRGRIIRSLRSLTRAAAHSEDRPASVEVVE